MKIVLQKLHQESTWRGIIALAAVAGWELAPQLGEAIVAAAVSIIGLINIIKKD